MSDRTITRKDVASGDILKIEDHHPHYDAFGFRAAATLRDAGFTATSGTADYHARYDRQGLVNVSRALDRDNWLYEGAINRAADYILGPTGFTLQAKTGVDGVNRLIEQLWREFAENPEIRHLFDLAALQRINFREQVIAGDTLWAKLGDGAGDDAGRLQHFESERIAARSQGDGDGRIEQGVVLNKQGQITGFKIAGVGSTGYIRTNETEDLAAADAIYCLNPVKRTSQTRGMPYMVSGMPLAHRLDDILTSETISWQTMSRLALAFTRDKATMRPAIREGHNAEAKTAPGDDEIAKLITTIGYSILVQPRPGEKVEGIRQNRPAPNFEQSVKLFVRLFGVPFGIPLEMMLFDYGRLNYSSFRGLLLQAFMNFRFWQQHLARGWLVPFYRWKIGRWIAEGRLAWRPGIFNHTWDVPGWPWIDEDKEVSAWAKKIDRGLATQTQALASLAKDIGQQRLDRKGEILAAWSTAREIEEETDGSIKAADIWKHLAGLSEGKTERAARAAKEKESDDERDDDDEGPRKE